MSARQEDLRGDIGEGAPENSAGGTRRPTCAAQGADQRGEDHEGGGGAHVRAVEQVLEAACALALQNLSAPEVLSLLTKSSSPVEAIGHITSLHDSFFICATSQGDVFVPKHLVPGAAEDFALCEGTSWILTMLPSVRRRTQWRAVAVVHNNEGWQSAGRARRAPKSARLPWGGCGKPPARTPAAPREWPARVASGRRT